MDDNFEELYKIYDINTALNNLNDYQVVVPNIKDGTTRQVPLSCTNDFNYVRNYVYKLKADNQALNLVVDKLTKEEKSNPLDKWVTLALEYGGGELSIRLKDIDFIYFDNNNYRLNIKNDTYSCYKLKKEAYEELKKLLVGVNNE